MKIKTIQKKDKPLWDAILNGEKTISDKEAGEMRNSLKEIRKEKDFEKIDEIEKIIL